MADKKTSVVLRYIGGTTYVNGVPARDLTQADIENSGQTVEQLLAYVPRVYARVETELADAPKAKEAKA